MKFSLLTAAGVLAAINQATAVTVSANCLFYDPKANFH
jgi:hypothetical protein